MKSLDRTFFLCINLNWFQRDLEIPSGLRKNLHRSNDYVVKAEDNYLLNEMKVYINIIEKPDGY